MQRKAMFTLTFVAIAALPLKAQQAVPLNSAVLPPDLPAKPSHPPPSVGFLFSLTPGGSGPLLAVTAD